MSWCRVCLICHRNKFTLRQFCFRHAANSSRIPFTLYYTTAVVSSLLRSLHSFDSQNMFSQTLDGNNCTEVFITNSVLVCKGKVHPRGGLEVQLYSFFNLGARWGWVGNATPRPLYPGKETRYPLNRSLGGPQGRSGRVRKISPPPGFDPRTVQLVESRYTD